MQDEGTGTGTGRQRSLADPVSSTGPEYQCVQICRPVARITCDLSWVVSRFPNSVDLSWLDPHLHVAYLLQGRLDEALGIGGVAAEGQGDVAADDAFLGGCRCSEERRHANSVDLPKLEAHQLCRPAQKASQKPQEGGREGGVHRRQEGMGEGEAGKGKGNTRGSEAGGLVRDLHEFCLQNAAAEGDPNRLLACVFSVEVDWEGDLGLGDGRHHGHADLLHHWLARECIRQRGDLLSPRIGGGGGGGSTT